MNERLKIFRESLVDKNGKKYSQAKFAEAMNVTRDMIATYEGGRVIPSDLFIRSLCDRYGVNENWLRTGEGEMFAPITRNDEIANIAKNLLGEDNPIRLQLTKIVCNLTNEQIKSIYEMAKQFVEAVEKDPE